LEKAVQMNLSFSAASPPEGMSTLSSAILHLWLLSKPAVSRSTLALTF